MRGENLRATPDTDAGRALLAVLPEPATLLRVWKPWAESAEVQGAHMFLVWSATMRRYATLFPGPLADAKSEPTQGELAGLSH